MEIRIDNDEFGKRQLTLIYAIIRFIKDELQAAGLPKEQVLRLSAEIGFAVASAVDGSRVMYQRSSGQRLQPVLMFADDADSKKLIAHSGSSSHMHEYVHGIVQKMSEAESA
jgi:hypothetical protein